MKLKNKYSSHCAVMNKKISIFFLNVYITTHVLTIHKSLESNKVSKNNQCTVLTLRWRKKEKKKKETKEIKETKDRKRTSLSPFTSHKNRNRPQHTYIRQVFIIPNSFQRNYLTRTSFAYCNMYFVFFIVNERCTR